MRQKLAKERSKCLYGNVLDNFCPTVIEERIMTGEVLRMNKLGDILNEMTQ